MVNDLDDLDEPERRLCEVLAVYFEAVKAGEAPERDLWLAQYPDLAGQLTAFLEEEDRLLRVTGPLRSIAQGTIGGPYLEATQGSSCRPAPDGNGTDHDKAGSAVRVFGDYELFGEPAYGGMSVVHRAVQRSLNRPVALKMLRGGAPARTTCGGFASRLRRSPTSTIPTSSRSTRWASAMVSVTSR